MNKVIKIKGKVELSSLTKMQEKTFIKKYGKYCPFDDNTNNFISRSMILKKIKKYIIMIMKKNK